MESHTSSLNNSGVFGVCVSLADDSDTWSMMMSCMESTRPGEVRQAPLGRYKFTMVLLCKGPKKV